MIALVSRTVDCGTWKGPSKRVLSYRFYIGDAEDDIQRKIAADRQSYPEIVSAEIIRLIDTRKELERLERGGRAVEIGKPVD